MMEEAGREILSDVVRVPVLAVLQILLDDFHERWILNEPVEGAVEGGGESRDGGSK